MVSFSHFLIPLFPLAFFLIFLHKFRRNNHALTSRKKLKIPPSPSKLPLIGNLHQLGLFPHRSLHSLSQHCGPLMLLHYGRVPVLVATSSDAAREIMKNKDLVFSNRPKLTIPDKLLYDSKDVAFCQYGEYWRHVRSICVLQLLSAKRVQSFRRVREEETTLMIENIRELASSSSSSSVIINLSDMLVLLTNDVICRIVLGRKYSNGEEGIRFKKMFAELTELLGTSYVGDYIPWLAWISRATGLDARVEKLAKRFDEFLESVVEEHRSKKRERMQIIGETSKDFVDILLEYQRDNKDSSPIENDDIKAIILDMFAAGTDTTVSALEWTMAEILRHPKTMERLQQEVRKVAGGKEEITEDDLEKMQYLKAVFKESLRLHSPIPLLVARESTQDTKVMGYDVAAGTQVVVNAWSIARDPSLWENPEDFIPERFLKTNIDFRGLHFELIPFGAGRRGCPGITFAMAVNELALAKLVHKFNFELPNGGRFEDLDVAEATGLTIHKKSPLLVVAKPYTC